VLLALATIEQGVAATVLRDLGVTGERILATSCMHAGSDERWKQERLSVMPRLKQSLEHGRRIANELEVRLADTEHLLAGIVSVTDSMAVEILRRLGVSVAEAAPATDSGAQHSAMSRAPPLSSFSRTLTRTAPR